MAVKIRLTRRGRKKMAMYDVIVADARSPRDGKLIEKLGTYNPLTDPATINIDSEKTLDWLLKGAQPTDTARRILSYKGIMLKKHLQVGVLKGAITQEQADKKFDEWLKGKESQISDNVASINKKKADEAKAKLEAEKKVNEAKAEALKQKMAALVPEEEAPAVVEETQAEASATTATVEEDKKEEAPAKEAVAAEEAKAEEAPAKEAVAAVEAKAEEAPAADKKAKKAPVAEEKKAEAQKEDEKK